MYGLTEVYRDQVKSARLVSSPASFPMTHRLLDIAYSPDVLTPVHGVCVYCQVANPGCYPTTVQLPLIPLLRVRKKGIRKSVMKIFNHRHHHHYLSPDVITMWRGRAIFFLK